MKLKIIINILVCLALTGCGQQIVQQTNNQSEPQSNNQQTSQQPDPITCLDYNYSNCPEYCQKICIPSECWDNCDPNCIYPECIQDCVQECTSDCDGPDSCIPIIKE